MDAVVLILSDARGVYIPRDFLTDNQNEIVSKQTKTSGSKPLTRRMNTTGKTGSGY